MKECCRKGNWYVSQCLEVDVAGEGESEEGAQVNLKEALELHFEPPQATRSSKVRAIEVEVGRLKQVARGSSEVEVNAKSPFDLRTKVCRE